LKKPNGQRIYWGQSKLGEKKMSDFTIKDMLAMQQTLQEK